LNGSVRRSSAAAANAGKVRRAATRLQVRCVAGVWSVHGCLINLGKAVPFISGGVLAVFHDVATNTASNVAREVFIAQ
jgi:hypothetical protein